MPIIKSILVTGGHGLVGKAIKEVSKKNQYYIIYLGSKMCDLRNYNDIKEINISSNTIICIEFDCVDNENSDHLEVDSSFSCYRKIKSHDSKNLYVGFFGKIIK